MRILEVRHSFFVFIPRFAALIPWDHYPVIQVPSELSTNQADPNVESITVNPVASVAGEKRNVAGAGGWSGRQPQSLVLLTGTIAGIIRNVNTGERDETRERDRTGDPVSPYR